MKDEIEMAGIERLADILLKKLKTRVVLQMVQVGESSRKKVIGGNDGMPFRQQCIAQMRTYKTCTTRHERSESRHA